MKIYNFRYSSNSSVERYEALLGCIGYQFLGEIPSGSSVFRYISVMASDYKNDSLTAVTTVRLRQFIPSLIFEPIPEICIYEDQRPNATALCVLRVISAESESGRPVDNLDYAIVGGNIGNAFAVDNEGQLFLINKLDRETTPYYTLTIQASAAESSANTTVSIKVADVNDNKPIVADY